MGDLRDTSVVESALADLKPSRIWHLATGSGEPDSADYTQVAYDQQMLSNLVYAMPDHCQLIYTGSMAEYGRAGMFDEFDRCAPDSVYACAKLLYTHHEHDGGPTLGK